MQTELGAGDAKNTQRRYGRLAGCLYLGVIIVALSGGVILSRIAGNGTFAETSQRIAASEHLYRAALSAVAAASISSALLAFALYATLRAVNGLVAQLAMIFSVGDSFLALIVRMCSFVRLHLNVSSQAAGAGTTTVQALADLMSSIAGTTENLGGILFGIGSFLFFCLFFKSRYIPRVLSALGIAASVIWTILYFANLIFPEHHALFLYICFPPMAVADLLTGLYLVLFSVRLPVNGN